MNKTLQLVSSLEAIKTVTQGENTREMSYVVVANKQHTQLYSGTYLEETKTENIVTLRITSTRMSMKTLHHSVINNYINTTFAFEY